jgi:glutamyl-tRNA reductase
MGDILDNHIAVGVLGISHKTASVEIRELVSLNEVEQKSIIEHIKNDFNVNGIEVDGILILSTCNRTEFYISAEKIEMIFPAFKQLLATYKKCPYYTDENITYEKTGYDAVRHFFNVICGIDSQIVGELQITGQVKDCYNFAHHLEATDAILNKLYNFGMQVKKKVRNETFLSDGTVSVSFAGVELARKIFNDLTDKRILLVGAGKTAELAAFHFLENNVKSINVANRTLRKAEELADKFGGRSYTLDSLQEALEASDIVISATSSDDYVIKNEMMKEITKRKYYDSIFLIDLAIPRDIDPKVEDLGNVYLYNLDDLNGIVEQNLEKRRKEIPRASKIVDEYLHEFQSWASINSMTTVISKLKNHLETISNNELARLRKQYPDNGYQKELDNYTQSIINKLVRQHMKSLKKNAGDPEKYKQHIELIYNLYEIDIDK